MRVLSAKTPPVWRALGDALHQDWATFYKDCSLASALDDTVNGFALADREELFLLVSELQSNASSTGDFHRAWNKMGASLFPPSRPRTFFVELFKALENSGPVGTR